MSVLDSKRSGRRVPVIAALVVGLLLSGCAATVDTRITAYHAWPAKATQPSYRFTPPSARLGSLEQAAHQALARPELQRAGFTESAQGRFGITLRFTEERSLRRVIEPVQASPWFGWGGWSGGWHGWGMGVVIPIGSLPARDETWWQHTLSLRIDDLSVQPPRRVFESTATTEDLGADPARLLPVMLRQALEGFPGVSGVARRVRTPLN